LDILSSNGKYSKRASSAVPWSPLNISKIGMSLVLIGIELILLFEGLNDLQVKYPVDMYSHIVKAATYVSSFLQKKKTRYS